MYYIHSRLLKINSIKTPLFAPDVLKSVILLGRHIRFIEHTGLEPVFAGWKPTVIATTLMLQSANLIQLAGPSFTLSGKRWQLFLPAMIHCHSSYVPSVAERPRFWNDRIRTCRVFSSCEVAGFTVDLIRVSLTSIPCAFSNCTSVPSAYEFKTLHRIVF